MLAQSEMAVVFVLNETIS